MRPVLQTTVDPTAAGRQLGQTHADLCAVEFRKHVVSCSSRPCGLIPISVIRSLKYKVTKFIGWLHPIYRHRIATFRRTNDARRPGFTCAPNHLDFPPSDDIAANEAITFLIQGIPQPELIESLQNLQLFSLG